ncbi:MAG: DNA repair protein, partial [Clostridia bacterium]|nr:DNA repair protein [Clostridia bacterium]
AALPPAAASHRLEQPTCDCHLLMSTMADLFRLLADRLTPVKRLAIAYCDLSPRERQQLSLLQYDNPRTGELQSAVNDVRLRYGKNALFRGMDLLDGATTRERNTQIGGHRSGEAG